MITALAIAIALSSAPSPSADEVFADGQQLYQEGKFAAAADVLERAYGLDPRPEFLYAWAQAERRADDCRNAVELYERFLATDPAEDLAEFARENQRVCAKRLAAETPNEPPPPRVAPKTTTDAAPAGPDRDPRPWHRDPLGGALLGVGVAAIATGIGLRVGAEIGRESADDSAQHSAYDQEIRRARTLAGAGIGVLTAGGALVVGAVIRYAILARARKHRR